MPLFINLADAVAPTLANGPGVRAALFTQGCSIGCPGCQNPQTWPSYPVHICTPDAIVAWYRSFSGLRGVTLSGGEPFEQSLGLAAFCRDLRRLGADVIA